MHKIRFPLGLRPRHRCGSLQRSPKYIYGGILLRGGKARDREREGREGVSEKRGCREGTDKPTPNILA